MVTNIKKNNKNNSVKSENYYLERYGIGKTITEEGEYLAHISEVEKNARKSYVCITPYEFENGEEVTYESLKFYLNDNNAEDSIAGQFIKLFKKAKTDKEIKDQPVMVYIELNEVNGKCYKNILEITKVDKAKLEEHRKSTMRNEADELAEESALNAEE